MCSGMGLISLRRYRSEAGYFALSSGANHSRQRVVLAAFSKIPGIHKGERTRETTR